MRTILLLASVGCAYAQLTIQAGSPSDVFHTPTAVCVWSGATSLNPPCVTQFKDAVGTLFYAAAPAVLTYTLPAPAGTCDVAITAYEPNKTAAGQRVFSVSAQGQASGPIDLFTLAGLGKPYTLLRAGVPVMNGTIAVQFVPMVGNPVVQTLALQNCQPPVVAPPSTLPITIAPDGTIVLTGNLFVTGGIFSGANVQNAVWRCTGATGPASDCTGLYFIQIALQDGTVLKVIGSAPADPTFTITPQWAPIPLPSPPPATPPTK